MTLKQNDKKILLRQTVRDVRLLERIMALIGICDFCRNCSLVVCVFIAKPVPTSTDVCRRAYLLQFTAMQHWNKFQYKNLCTREVVSDI